jgi:DNA-directed RNA polymerase omega subunit
MHVVTPDQVANHTQSKYLGVLVAAKYARRLNEFRRGRFEEEPLPGELREKLTTTALEGVADGEVEFELVARRKPVEL